MSVANSSARRLKSLLGTGAILTGLIATLWVAAWQVAEIESADAVADATRTVSNLAVAYEESAANEIGLVDQRLQLIEMRYRQGAAEAIAEWPLDWTLVRGVAVVGREGAVLESSGDFAIVPMGRREDFMFHRASPTRELYIGRPEQMAVSGAWNVAISRRLNTPDGSFAGMAIAMVDPAYFTSFSARIDLGGNGLVSLVRRDGIAIASQAGQRRTFGRDLRASNLLARLALRANGGFTSAGTLDGTARITGYRSMAKYPLVVVVGTSYAEALAPMREHRRFYYLLAALASCLILLVAFALARSFTRAKRDADAIAQAQSRLHESEVRSKAITENMAGGVITTSALGVITGINDAACRLYGFAANELLGMPILALVHESRRAHAFAVIQDLLARPGDFKEGSREMLCVRKDGTPFESEILLSSVSVGGERIYIGTVQDISERKAGERAVHASEARYRAAFDQALIGIVHCDLEGRFTRANPAFCDMLGYTEEEMLARGYRDVTHADHVEQSRARMAALLAEPQAHIPSRSVKRYVRKDGSTIWALSSLSVIRRDDGSTDYFLAMIQDITELKRVEQMKDEFVSAVSHELRTPLTSINGSLGLLSAGVAGALPGPALDLVTIAARNCARLVRLVNDILDSEKIESGNLRFKLAVADLRTLARLAIEANEGFARGLGITVTLASGSEPVPANVDADRFTQVMTNLLSNAVKFSRPGEPVEVTVSRRDGQAQVEVRDHGVGIPAEFRRRIFQRFSQADGSDSRHIGGTGLGLSIAKAIVERLGGTIGFESVAGKGTAFHVRFPLAASVHVLPAVDGDVSSREERSLV
jgi:PAS domain S-box-containing protein